MKEGPWLKKAKEKGLVKDTASVNLDTFIPSLDTPLEILSQLDEATWQKMVVVLAEVEGWKVAHCRKVKIKRGKREWWETTMPKGWFDLVLARDSNRSHRDSLYFVELKVHPNTQEPEQKEWEKLMTACGHTCFLWYPEHWQVIQKVLSKPVSQ